jgi:hypothetical protein
MAGSAELLIEAAQIEGGEDLADAPNHRKGAGQVDKQDERPDAVAPKRIQTTPKTRYSHHILAACRSTVVIGLSVRGHGRS